jgi:sortase A
VVADAETASTVQGAIQIVPTPTPIPLIPAIDLDAAVEGAGWLVTEQNNTVSSVWDVPPSAAGWHKNSALQGDSSNVVLSGHHNLGAEVFRDLVDLEIGDELTLQSGNYHYHYQISDRFIVPELNAPPEQQAQNAQWILPTVDERVTLVTCWPYTGNSHRLIVVTKPPASPTRKIND